MKLITQAYFAQTDAPSFNAHVRLWNKRSCAALKKFGFKDVGFYYENGEPTRYMLEYKRP
jgi:RimJ/RimL family protein N-acetyltransferase